MNKKKRIAFSFDQRSFEALNHIKNSGGFSSLGETVKTALQILGTWQDLRSQGFSELLFRNPKTKEERICVI
jgi:hypothetical protein